MADHQYSSSPEQPQTSGIAATAQSVVNGTHPQVQKTVNDLKGFANSAKHNEDDDTLTHFHSFFYDLFTWKYPRSTALIATSVLTSILAFHYVNVLRYVFKAAYLLFASVAFLECAAKPLGAQGFVSQMRPRRYYTIPRESLESIFAELHDLMNFFVVEFQRIVFVENIFTTIMAFATTFIGYFLIKYLPIWGLLFLSAIAAFTGPLVYLHNQEAIDEQIDHFSQIVNEKLTQAKHVGEKYAEDAAAQVKATTNQLTDRLSTMTVPRRSKTPEPKKPLHHDMPTPPHEEAHANVFPAVPIDELPKPEPAPSYEEDLYRSKLVAE